MECLPELHSLYQALRLGTLYGVPKMIDEHKCNPHHKAPHGFDRNASHSADRYVCECESWDAYEAGFNDGFQAGMEAEQALYALSENTQEMER